MLSVGSSVSRPDWQDEYFCLLASDRIRAILRESVTPPHPMTTKQAEQAEQQKHASDEPTIDELAKQALAAFDALAGVL